MDYSEEGLILSPAISLSNETEWALSAGVVWNTVHNRRAMATSLCLFRDGAADAPIPGIIPSSFCLNMVSSAIRLCIVTPSAGGSGTWSCEGSYFEGSSPTDSYSLGDGTFTLDAFPRADGQTSTISLARTGGHIVATLSLGEITYELLDVVDTLFLSRKPTNPYRFGIMCVAWGGLDQMLGEEGENLVGSPVCCIDWVRIASTA